MSDEKKRSEMTEEERKAAFRDRLTNWGGLKIPSAEDGATFEAHGRQWTIVRIASGTSRNPTGKRSRGLSHAVATTDGGIAKLYATCSCAEPGEEVKVMDLVTESFWRVCSKCRARLRDREPLPGRELPAPVLAHEEPLDRNEDDEAYWCVACDGRGCDCCGGWGEQEEVEPLGHVYGGTGLVGYVETSIEELDEVFPGCRLKEHPSTDGKVTHEWVMSFPESSAIACVYNYRWTAEPGKTYWFHVGGSVEGLRILRQCFRNVRGR